MDNKVVGSISQQSIAVFASGVLIGVSLCLTLPLFIGDIEFFVRSYAIDLFSKREVVNKVEKEQQSELPSISVEGIVLPSWLDRNMHMSNARYVYELNFSRRHFFHTKGFWDFMRNHNCIFLVQAQSIRYRKELNLWDRFIIQTRVIDWNDRESCFYVESRFIHKATNFISAIHHLKYKIVDHAKSSTEKIRPTDLLTELGLIPANYHHRDPLLLTSEQLHNDNNTFVSLWENANHRNSLELNPSKKLK